MSRPLDPERRRFLRGTGAALLGASALPACSLVTQRGNSSPPERFEGRLVVSTWNFGMAANAAAWSALQSGVPHPVYAAAAGARVPEADPAVTSVGYGGSPNAKGVMELDACVMRGDNLACGGVAGLRGFAHPVSVALDVMDHTPHVLLVGEGAGEFAASRGHEQRDLLSAEAAARYAKWQTKQERPAPIDDHDTIGLITLDNGHFGMAVTTSGWAFKLPGRVGDSPIIGAGGYCDNEAGACVATGTGEEMIRHVAAFAVVEQMRNGLSAKQAAVAVLARIRRNFRARDMNTMVALLAVDTSGGVAGVCTTKNFEFAVHDEDHGGVLHPGEHLAP
ncbi:MAG: asparaginase [Planctomycetota bacterium]|nr:MAG: asparaginase [Planctomycetota bacterium]